MPQFTSRMGLIKPIDGETVDVGDLNNNFDMLDQFTAGAYICTSTTRPTGANRWAGLNIQETDTGRRLFWDGAAWCVIPWRYGSWNVSTPESTGAKTADFRIGGIAVGVAPFDRLFTVNTYLALSSTSTGIWESRIIQADSGSTNNADTGTINSSTRIGPGGLGINVSGQFRVSSGDDKTIRAWVKNISAGTANVQNGNGVAMNVYWQEIDGTNRWSTYGGGA